MIKLNDMEIKPTSYRLENCLTHRAFDDTGWLMADPEDSRPSLVRAIYDKKQIDFKDPLSESTGSPTGSL